MKRGFIFLLAILLIMPFAFAGQVSDFFSYFTSDAFSLITGAQIAGFGRNNPAINNPADDLAGNTERTNTPPAASANKANGVTCRAHTDCKSGVCTKVSAQKAICGKKTGEACTTGAKSKCFSNKCGSGRCGLSPLGKSCITKADCEQGLNCKNNKCTGPMQAAPTTPAPPAAETNEEEPAEQNTASYKGLEWACYDGTPFANNFNICKTHAQLMELANKACNRKCNADGSKCGVNSYSFKDECGAAAETNVPASGANANEEVNTEEAALKEEIANTIEELKNKADELLGKHGASTANLLARTGILSRFPRLTGNFIFQAFITGAPIAGYGGSNLGDNLARTDNAVNIQKLNGARCTADSQCRSNYCNNAVPRVCAARQAVKKANGQSCTRSSDCNSGVCYKKAAADANGLCGKKQGVSCRENPECLSLTCGVSRVSRVCAKSILNGPCLQDSDCSTENCNVNTKRCAARVTPVAPPAPEEPASGTSSSSSGLGTTAPVREAQFDLILSQSILDGIYVKMNALKQKVCLEASKHTGINMGNIKCGEAA